MWITQFETTDLPFLFLFFPPIFLSITLTEAQDKIAGKGSLCRPGPLENNRWLLLRWNLLLFGSRVFSSSTEPPCHPVRHVLCWRPFSETDGRWLWFQRLCVWERAGWWICLNTLFWCYHFFCVAVTNVASSLEMHLRGSLRKQDHKIKRLEQII